MREEDDISYYNREYEAWQDRILRAETFGRMLAIGLPVLAFLAGGALIWLAL